MAKYRAISLGFSEDSISTTDRNEIEDYLDLENKGELEEGEKKIKQLVESKYSAHGLKEMRRLIKGSFRWLEKKLGKVPEGLWNQYYVDGRLRTKFEKHDSRKAKLRDYLKFDFYYFLKDLAKKKKKKGEPEVYSLLEGDDRGQEADWDGFDFEQDLSKYKPILEGLDEKFTHKDHLERIGKLLEYWYQQFVKAKTKENQEHSPEAEALSPRLDPESLLKKEEVRYAEEVLEREVKDLIQRHLPRETREEDFEDLAFRLLLMYFWRYFEASDANQDGESDERENEGRVG